jgi:glyoxylase-like metal-dependent hydrolase (beta-lactamase superfamily II)
MTSRRHPLLLALTLLSVPAALPAAGCSTSSHPTRPAALGAPARSASLLAVLGEPGPLEVETVVSADWKVDRSGLINLEHPRAKEAGLQDGLEDIQVYFHVVRHPTRGLFVVDTGVERALRDAPDRAAVRGLAARALKAEHLKVRTALGDFLASERAPLAGVLLTHLHLDHLLGMPDVPADVPVFLGPGETEPRAVVNVLARGVTDRALAGKGALHTWAFRPDPDGRFAGVLDVFGDGSLWALWVPGHTPGSTAYVARTKDGPVLLAGDTCHTAWGWRNGVEPGAFTADHAKNAQALEALRALAAAHPALQVRLGHQAL